ncbi:MAG: histidinol-phosphate transaminase [Pyrinomonadaceae bacterium]
MSALKASLSRRSFTRLLGAGTALAALRPIVTLTAPARRLIDTATAAPVRLSSNENPYGPSPMALKAMTDAFGLAWRYPDEHADALTEALAKLHGIAPERILLGNGSGEILKLCAAALTGAGRRLVVADPTFEAIARHATMNHAEVSKIPLTADYRHDLPKMLAATKDAGLVYICNPNNPTASITPKSEVRAFLAQVPRETIVLVDEAYHHYAETQDYESVSPLVATQPNLIVARTFSKIYGMAGLRCGYCVAQPDIIERLRPQQTWDSTNIMALVAAHASLQDGAHVAQGRRLNTAVKQQVYAELDRLKYTYIPSAANFLMIDLRRDVRPVIKALREQRVEVGRFFPALPTHLRVTIGTRDGMQTFLAAFRQVLA